MLIEVKAPELSESVQSGSLLEWRKQVGDTVRRDEPLTDLETDKVILEVSAPASGILKEIRMPAGSEVKAGDVLAVIDAEAGAGEEGRAGPGGGEARGTQTHTRTRPRAGRGAGVAAGRQD